MIDLKKLDTVQFLLIVLVLTFIFCLILSNQFRATNDRVFKLLEYQTRLLGETFERPVETGKGTVDTSKYSQQTQNELRNYQNEF